MIEYKLDSGVVKMNLLLGASVVWWVSLLAVLFFIVCVFMILIILLQKGRGGGLSSAFGGAGGQSAFGSKTGDVFTWVTVITVGVFFLLSIVLSLTFKPENPDDKKPGLDPVPAAQQPTTTPAGTDGDKDAGTDKDATNTEDKSADDATDKDASKPSESEKAPAPKAAE